MSNWLAWWLDSSDFPRRWDCLSELGWGRYLDQTMDVGIWISYVLISIAIGYVAWRRWDDVTMPKLYWLFVGFIFTCGLTHLFGQLVYYWTCYRFLLFIKVACLIFSLPTALLAFPVAEYIIHLPTKKEYARANEEFEQAIKKLTMAKKQIDDQIVVIKALGPKEDPAFSAALEVLEHLCDA